MTTAIYTYGSQSIVTVTGQPEEPVQIGIGEDRAEAIAALRATPIQSAGRAGQASLTALRWACGQGWLGEGDVESIYDAIEGL